MLSWVVTFLVIALIAGILGFGGIAGASIEIAKTIFFIAIILFLISAVISLARGRSRIRESLFEKRFLQAAELRRMGAWVRIENNVAIIEGVPYLEGAPIMASDIRAGAALVVAALAARGTTAIQRVYHIDRGYERMEEKLRRAGARIRRVHNLRGTRAPAAG